MGNERLRDNWDLSAARAANTYRLITAFAPQISDFSSAPPESDDAKPLMSVAGYADQRPVALGDDEASKARNRRIDIRFIMAGPKPAE
jgi:flagellar motor protein MotB